MMLYKIYYTKHFSDFEESFKTIGHLEKLQAGSALLQEPTKEIIHYILSGVVMSFYPYENGKMKISGYFGPGQIVPYISCLPIDMEFIRPKMYLPSVCLNDVELLTFGRNDFHKIYYQSPELQKAVFNWVAFRHDKYEYETFFLSNSSAYIKVCSFLYSNEHLFSEMQKEGLHLTQDDIGNIVGESRIDVARAYKKLRDSKIITTSRGKVKIIDHQRLEDILHQAEGLNMYDE